MHHWCTHHHRYFTYSFLCSRHPDRLSTEELNLMCFPFHDVLHWVFFRVWCIYAKMAKKPYRKPPRKSRAFEVACLRLTQQYSYKHSWLIRVLQPKNKLWFLFLWFIFSGKLVLLVDSVQYMYLIRRVRFRICHFDTRCMF